MTTRRLVHLLGGFSLLLLALPATAEVIEIGPGANLQAEVDALIAGDELVLRGGTYILPSRFSIEKVATAATPIVIRAKTGEVPVIEYPSANQNVINVENSRHVILRGLEVTGGSHGIRLKDSSFITIEDCHIHHVGDVGLSANIDGGTYEGLRILRNHIHDTDNTGEGMYLGCNWDGCQMFDSLIEGNYIHHTDANTVDQGDGIEIKEGSYNNTVRHNVIHDTNYPCLITYSTVGNGGPNILEGNVLWNCGDHAIQSAADAVIRNNIILGAAVDGIRNQPHQTGVPANLVITHNTVIAGSNNALRVNGADGVITIANNALYAQSGDALHVAGDVSSTTAVGNYGVGNLVGLASGLDSSGSLAQDFVSATYSGSLPQDVFPSARSGLVGAGSAGWVAEEDFNATPRNGFADAGAYRWSNSGNPGWTLAEEFKDLVGIFDDGFETGGTGAWTAVVP